MKKRKIVFIICLSIAIAGIIFLRFYRIEPVKISHIDDGYAYSFQKRFSSGDILVFNGPEEISFLELHFSNNRVMRYVNSGSVNNLSHLSKWRDPAGRTRVAPVVVIYFSPSPKNVISVGRDYLRYTGDITRGMILEKIVSNVFLDSIALTNFIMKKKRTPTASCLEKTGEFKLRKIHLPATIEDSHVQTWEYVYPSGDNKFLALSSFDGYVYFIDAESGKLLWNYHIPDGRLTSITMSDDNEYVFVGEQSTDGNVYCFSADKGKIIWKYSTAQDIGSLDDTLLEAGLWSGMVKPNVREVITNGDTLYIRSRRTRLIEANGRREKIKIAKIYAFDRKTGRLKWTYPKNGRLEGYRNSVLRISQDGKYASWVTFDWDKEANPLIFVFNAENGEILWKYQCDTIEKYFKSSTAYAGVAFSIDSHYAAAALNDGRMMVFDNLKSIERGKGVVLNIIKLTVPIEAGTVPVMTYMSRHLFTRDNNLIVSTGNTYTTPFADTKLPPMYHPNATSIFCLNIQGELLWRFTAGGNPNSIDLRYDKNREYLAVSFCHNVRSKDINEHGFYIFDLAKDGGSFSKIKSFYHTDGICVDARLAPDLSRVFAIEAVIDMDLSSKVDYRGEHRLNLFKINHD